MTKQINLILVFIIAVFSSCQNRGNTKKPVVITKEIHQTHEDVVFGSNDAPNTIYLFASYNCKYCRYTFLKTFPELKKNYLDTGLLKVVVKWIEFSNNYETFYSLQAASCIYQFGQYDKFHELLLTNPSVIVSEDFMALIDDIMSENSDIAQCISSHQDFAYIKENVKSFRENKLSGTPCLIVNNKGYSGYMPYETLDKLLKRELNF